LTDQQRPPIAVLWRDLATLGRDQEIAFEPPAGPSLGRQFEPRQHPAKFVDCKRYPVRAGFPVMPSAIRDLKIFPRILDRPAEPKPGIVQPGAKLGAGFRVMGTSFPVI